MAAARTRSRTARSSALGQIEALKASFGTGAAARKVELLGALERARLRTAKQVLRLHEVLCFLRAHPDDASVLATTERMLAGFSQRVDLRRCRAALADTGIAGTAIHYPFFAPTARWLVQRWPGRVSVDWRQFAGGELLEQRLSFLATYAETPGLDEHVLPVRQWIARLKGHDETDAAFLVRRLAQLGADEFQRDALYEELGLTLRLAAGADTPSRTLAALAVDRHHFQTEPLRRARPDLRRAIAIRPRSVRDLPERDAARVIELAREAMITRGRDLDAFMHGDARDVRMVDCGDGLAFACIGVRPQRRLVLESVYAYLTLQNGVPIGYVLTSGLLGSSEIAYNVFDTWRGGEAAHVYGHVLATTRLLFGSDTFTVYPYQLGGEGNREGQRSGAWWFYQKLGFRARDAAVLALMNRELAAMRRDPAHRTDLATLRRLAQHNVFFSLGRARDDVIGRFGLAEVGLAVTDYLARRFGSARERGLRVCAAEAARRCGLRSTRGWTADEVEAWQRWAPLLMILPGIQQWSRAERVALVQVVRAKGGRRESEFVRRCDRHCKLRAALRRLAAAP